MRQHFPGLDLVLVESGGDNLAATFSPELADLTIYVIDVSGGEKIPRKGGPGITRSDLLVINKIDLAPFVGADLGVMERDAKRMRGERPFVFTNLRAGAGVDEIARFIEEKGAGWGWGEHPPPRSGGGGTARQRGEGAGLLCQAATCPFRLAFARHLPRKRGRKSLTSARMLPCRFQVAVTLHRCAHQEAIAFADDTLGIALLDVRMADHDIVLLAGVDHLRFIHSSTTLCSYWRGIAELLREIAFADQHGADARHIGEDVVEIFDAASCPRSAG